MGTFSLWKHTLQDPSARSTTTTITVIIRFLEEEQAMLACMLRTFLSPIRSGDVQCAVRASKGLKVLCCAINAQSRSIYGAQDQQAVVFQLHRCLLPEQVHSLHICVVSCSCDGTIVNSLCAGGGPVIVVANGSLSGTPN